MTHHKTATSRPSPVPLLGNVLSLPPPLKLKTLMPPKHPTPLSKSARDLVHEVLRPSPANNVKRPSIRKTRPRSHPQSPKPVPMAQNPQQMAISPPPQQPHLPPPTGVIFPARPPLWGLSPFTGTGAHLFTDMRSREKPCMSASAS